MQRARALDPYYKQNLKHDQGGQNFYLYLNVLELLVQLLPLLLLSPVLDHLCDWV